MTTKAKPKSRILEAVHETANDLHRLGFIDKRKIREFDALCLATQVPEYNARKIRVLRERYKLSQAVFAEGAGKVHLFPAPWDKAAHFVYYGIMAALFGHGTREHIA